RAPGGGRPRAAGTCRRSAWRSRAARRRRGGAGPAVVSCMHGGAAGDFVSSGLTLLAQMNRQVLLYTDDFRAAATEVENAGGRPLHVFSRRVFVAALPDQVEPESLTKASTRPPE